jgi:hypothetical protein
VPITIKTVIQNTEITALISCVSKVFDVNVLFT